MNCLTNEHTFAHHNKVLDQFLSGELQILVTTNMNSRCLDANVGLVINLGAPVLNGLINTKVYQYRAGRTARFNSGGTVLTIDTLPMFAKFKTAIERDLHVTVNPKMTYDC